MAFLAGQPTATGLRALVLGIGGGGDSLTAGRLCQLAVERARAADLETLNPGRPDEEALGVTYGGIDDLLEGRPVGEPAFTAVVDRYRRTEHRRRLPIAF